LIALLLLAWTLRLPPMLDNRLHPDEALYGYWGLLISQGRDPWLVKATVDKPPLWPYVIAGALALFGNSEFTLRLPGLAAGLLMVPLTAALARWLYHDRWTPTPASAGVALSPFAILFSGTAFPDALMVTLGTGSCVAAALRRPGWAGLLAGLSIATKQTGLVWLPLVLVVTLIQASDLKTWGSRFTLSLVLTVGLMGSWDMARTAQGAKNSWAASVIAYGGLRLIWPEELRARLYGWAGLARLLFASPILNTALLASPFVLTWTAVRRSRHTDEGFVDLLLVSFSIAYLLIHWLWAFPIWDRYLLPLIPLLAILLGRLTKRLVDGLAPLIERLPRRDRRPLSVICHLPLVILLALPALNAADSHYAVGIGSSAYDGIDQVVAFLRNQPEGTVIYHHWLGWHFNYYLFYAPIYLAYWPTPAWLAQDVQAFGRQEPRYISFPSWEAPARVEHALAQVGYGLKPVLATTRRDSTSSFTVYRIVPLPEL